MAKQYIEPTPLEVLREINFKPGFNQKATEKELVEYLNLFPFINPILSEAHQRLKELYPDADFVLDILIDPEDPQDGTALILYFFTFLQLEKASVIFDKFEEDWWIDACAEGQGKFSILMGFK
jgi:hypothetical protein